MSLRGGKFLLVDLPGPTLGQEALVAVDQEGGMVMRVLESPQAPSAMALGAAGNKKLAFQVGQAVGRGSLSLRINWNFAPVLDAHTNPDNPIIGERGFGGHPGQSGRTGAGLGGRASAGVLAAAKHFPGRRDTYQDSNLTLPRVEKSLEATDFYPFKQPVQAGIGSAMTAHIVFSKLDAENPAALSKRILTGFLREQCSYDRLVVTDAMNMKAISGRYPLGEAAVKAISAGADMICALGSRDEQAEQVEGLEAARPPLFSSSIKETSNP